jgi:hypothetical protein
MKPKCITTPHERRCKKCQTNKSCEVVEDEVAISHKRPKGELVLEADKSSSGDEMQEVGAPRGKSYQLHFTFSADIMQQNT